jgi:DNA-binding CsgD family transcriptional regulator
MGEADAMAWLRAISRLVHEPFVIVHDTVVVDANPAAEALFARSPLRGEPASLVLPVAAAEQQPVALHAAAGVAQEGAGSVATGTAAKVRDATGELRAVRWQCVHSGATAVHVFEPVHDLTALSAPNPTPDAARLAVLEAGLRNISWELQALGIQHTVASGPTVSPEQLRNLSPREREVLRAFLDGSSVAVCARLLHVSEHTVRSHLKSVYRKLGVRSQTELLRSMRSLGTGGAPVE